MPVVKIENLIKRFGKFTALNGIDLTVNQGEIYGFIGPNGAGKTTTIRILLGILKATEGKAKVFGMDAWKDAVEIHKNRLCSRRCLWPNLTGGEVIDLFVRLRNSNNNRRREELIERFNLDPSKMQNILKGQQTESSTDCSICIRCRSLCWMNPRRGLILNGQCFSGMHKRIKDQGKSVLLSSHILSEVEKLCDKISIIRHGKIMNPALR